MSKTRLRLLFITLCLALLGAACQGPAAPTGTPTSAPTVDAQALTGQAQVNAWAAATGTALHLTAVAPTATATEAVTPLPSSTPSATPTLAATATPAPSDTPSATPTKPAPTKAPPTKKPAPTAVPSETPLPTAAVPTPCTYTWFMSKAPTVCPGQAPVYSLTVAEHFQHGLMIWRQTPDVYGSRIYAFFYDHQWPYYNPTNDTWRQGDPESDPTIVPPAGLFQPVRGFGAFWRGANFVPAGSARDRLGWATDAEFSLGSQAMQCPSSAIIGEGCYLAGPDNLIYALETHNQWSLWPPP